MGKRRIEYMTLADLRDADRNPKDHDEDGIADSVERFGLIETVVLDERTKQLVAGHGRTNDLRRRHAAGDPAPDGIVVDHDGTWRVPVTRGWASTSDEEALAAGIALNRLNETGGWMLDPLAVILNELAASPLGLPPGYDSDGLADMMAALAAPLDVEAMAKQYGDHKEASLWPIIRVVVPPEVFDRYVMLMDARGEGDEAERFAVLLDLAEAGAQVTEAPASIASDVPPKAAE